VTTLRVWSAWGPLRPAGRALAWTAEDTVVMAGRSLRHWLRQPQLILLTTVQPIMLVLLFTIVFGGSVAVTGMSYVDYVVPGVLVQVVAWDSTQTAVGVTADRASGAIDRFRTMPMSPPALLAGRTVADAARNALVAMVMIGAGHLVGFRLHGLLFATAAVLLVVAFGFALNWVFALIGLLARGAETALAAGLVVVFPLMFASTALVPAATMPAWLRPLVEHQPISRMVDAARSLLLGAPDPAAIATALAWTFALLAVSAPIAVRRLYTR
jgi:ABC-2 type transport system permease protein